MKQNLGQKVNYGNNKLKLNKYHQIVRKDKSRNNIDNMKNLKKKIRDLERLIANGKLIEEIKSQKEKELQEMKEKFGQKSTVQKGIKKSKDYFNKKYNMIKKVELKKVARKLRKMDQQIKENTNTEQLEELKKERNEYYEKLMYIKNYPEDKKYISILKENTELGEQKKEEIKQQIMSRVNRKVERKMRYNEQQKDPMERQDDFFAEAEQEIVQKRRVNRLGIIE